MSKKPLQYYHGMTPPPFPQGAPPYIQRAVCEWMEAAMEVFAKGGWSVAPPELVREANKKRNRMDYLLASRWSGGKKLNLKPIALKSCE